METYGVAPEVVVSGDVWSRVPYIPAHLDYMVGDWVAECHTMYVCAD